MIDDRQSSPSGILFLCIANSARSQMAEGLGRHLLPRSTPVFSAGSAPRTVHPLAVAAMREIGIDIARHRSKHFSEIDWGGVGTVITLCDEACSALPAHIRLLHWPTPDPAALGGDRRQRMEAFRRARDSIERRVRDLALPRLDAPADLQGPSPAAPRRRPA